MVKSPGSSTSAARPLRRPRRSSRASKISVTVEAGVLREVKRLLRSTGRSLSAHVTEALERDLKRRRLQEIIAEYEASAGAITDDELAEVRAAWQG